VLGLYHTAAHDPRAAPWGVNPTVFPQGRSPLAHVSLFDL
jgi:hypothetical protein